MNEEFQEKGEDLRDIYLKPLSSAFDDKIKTQQEFLDQVSNYLSIYIDRLKKTDDTQDLLKCLSETSGLKENLRKLLVDCLPERNQARFEDDFRAFVDSSRTHLKTLPESISVPQKEERFSIQPNDHWSVKFRKPFKRARYSFGRSSREIGNFFRKEKKARLIWHHNVPVRKLQASFFVYGLANEALKLYTKLLKHQAEHADLLKSIDVQINEQLGQLINEKIDFEAFKKKIEEDCKIDAFTERKRLLENWSEESRTILDQRLHDLEESYHIAYDKVDTIELPLLLFSDGQLKKKKEELDESFIRIRNGWKNTYFAQLDDYLLDIELFHLKYFTLQQFYLLKRSCTVKIDRIIGDQINLVENEITLIQDKIDTQKDVEHIDELILIERSRIVGQLNGKFIPATLEVIYDQNLPYLLDRLETKIRNQIERIDSSRIIIDSSDYSKPIRKQDLDHFNPRELVEMNIFNHFIEINSQLKITLVQKLASIQTFIQDLSGIIDYNLESAESLVAETKDLDEIKKIANEGIVRTQDRITEIREELKSISILLDVELKDALSSFGNRLEALTTNENIIELRLTLAKAKAIERTKNYHKKIINNITNFLPLAFAFLKHRYQRGIDWLELGLKNIGLTETENDLSVELSEFLSETDKAIEQLPYVYRRLYKIEALDDENFFEGRSKELEQLELAHKRWEKGVFSACCITGEKGSGSSTLLNFFLRRAISEPIIRYQIKRIRYTPESLIELFGELLEGPFMEVDTIVDHLNEQKPRVIVFENIHHLFLKKIDGFDALKTLFEIVSKTSSKVFWLFNMSQYTFDYLNKTILIKRHFRFVIPLEKVNDQQMIDIIMKRHRVSGYRLLFEEPQINLSTRNKLLRTGTDQTQESLRKDFFKRLNQFAESNISLALLYWLRSTQKVENNCITVKSLSQTNFSFLKGLDNDSIFTLHSLILHESLSIDEHSAVFHQLDSLSKRMLMVLEDRGIVKQIDQRFAINHLLYRQIVNLLHNRNILH